MRKLIIFFTLFPLFCQSQTLVFACGFEEQYLNSVQTDAHWGSTGGTISTTTYRSGAAAYRSNPSSASQYATWNYITAGQTMVGRVYVRFATLPSVDVAVVVFINGANYEGVFFKNSDSKLYNGYGTGGTNTLGSTGASVTTGVWYLIDFKLIATGKSVV